MGILKSAAAFALFALKRAGANSAADLRYESSATRRPSREASEMIGMSEILSATQSFAG
jgi:hypothetical protein